MKPLLICILFFNLVATNLLAAQSDAPIYRWVDDKGVIHYADKPNNSSAVPVKVKSSTENIMTDNQANININDNVVITDVVTSNKDDEDKQYCEYIKEQIKFAKEAANDTNELKASYAAAYLTSSKKLLKDNNCN